VPFVLQGVKNLLLAVMYLCWVAVDVGRNHLWNGMSGAASLVALWPGWHNPMLWAMCCASAVVSGALADYWQVRGAPPSHRIALPSQPHAKSSQVSVTESYACLQAKGQDKVSAGEANIILSLDPLFCVCFATMFLHETLTTHTIVGGAIVIAASFIAAAFSGDAL
jgi:hypothetical protein